MALHLETFIPSGSWQLIFEVDRDANINPSFLARAHELIRQCTCFLTPEPMGNSRDDSRNRPRSPEHKSSIRPSEPLSPVMARHNRLDSVLNLTMRFSAESPRPESRERHDEIAARHLPQSTAVAR